ncbi:MAG: hypothetical protein CBC55_06105 [Gammaproteobacteria bacterium TMED95]|nr:hypothetical protein [Gammaproteobacteria bacterium]OUV21465.1 MAG: hypothetical protein CBC55_06105 [Gammaproteobacteria bacterium TMED95]
MTVLNRLEGRTLAISGLAAEAGNRSVAVNQSSRNYHQCNTEKIAQKTLTLDKTDRLSDSLQCIRLKKNLRIQETRG